MVDENRDPDSWEDWEAIVGRRRWKVGKSAYELARKWHGKLLPDTVLAALLSLPNDHFSDLALARKAIEHRTRLDTSNAPSFTDVMAHCLTPSGSLAILCVEGKGTESFGEPIVN